MLHDFTDLLDFSMIAAFMAVNTYLIDAFTLYAASAMAANTILRSVRKSQNSRCIWGEMALLTRDPSSVQILGGVFPLFGLQMYNALGLGWGNSLLGFVSLALSGVPVAFYYYGERLRNSKRFQVKF